MLSATVPRNSVGPWGTKAMRLRHVAASSAFYGVLAAYFAGRFPRFRKAIFSAAALAVLLVAVARMALAGHYLGDALAALAASGAWLAICLGSVHAWHAARPR